MRRFTHRLAPVLLTALVLLAMAVPALAADDPAAAKTVVIVLAPYVTWDDIDSDVMPHTRSLADSSAIGDLNVRSSARFVPDPGQPHIALTMSAGSPAAFDLLAATSYPVSAALETGTAEDAYMRSMGVPADGAEIVYLGMARILTAVQQGTFETVPGALGQSIVDAGGSTAAIGNSDGGERGGSAYRSRPAAILAMDAAGRVAFGDVSHSMQMDSPASPFGAATDMDALENAYRSALADTAGHGGPSLIVLDAGDPERAFNFRVDAAPDAAEKHRLAACVSVDETVAFALEALPDDAVLMVVSTGQVRPQVGPSGFGPVIVSGPGYEGGLIGSSSTHRGGLMTDLDVSATVLSILGIDRPVEMLGNPATAETTAEDTDGRITYLKQMNATAVAVDTVRPAVQNSYITVTVIILLICAALLRSMQRALTGWGGHAARTFSHVILLLLVMPVSATLMFLAMRRPGSAVGVAVLFVATTTLLWLVALVIDRRWGSAVALAVVGLLSAGALLLDQALGAPLSFSGLFSYSPLLGARYYGLGNEGASIVVGGGLTGVALLVDAFRDRPWIGVVRRWAPPVVGALVVIISAAPFLGANIGVIAWGTVAFGILWMHLNGRHITWKTILGMFAVIAAVVVAFSLYESLSASGAQTHLGRAWESAGTGGISELWLIVQRKAETNWRVLRATNWSILMIAILVFLGYMRWRPHGVFAETLKAYPGFAVGMTAALWGSLVGYFTEDSGIVIPALVLLYVTGSLLHIMLSRLDQPSPEVQQ